MVRGKTINIYLPDGNPKGIKICEIPNSIIKAIMIPRNLLKEIILTDNLEKVGIYFLFSEKDEFSQFKTYIGEAENLLIRLKQHDAKRDDWNYAICFLSGKDNLNKAHVKFLESYCYSVAQKVNRTTIQNSCSPTKSNLTKSDEDFSLSFFDEIKIILGVLGYPIFDELKKVVKKEEVFYCKGKNAIAQGNLTEEGFVVYLDSKSNLEESPSAGIWLENTRKRLLGQGILKKENDILVFTKDFSFGSPSTAAGVVLGRRANGWTEWKNAEGRTLDELKRKDVDGEGE